ncbi:unnamed protein product [Cyprideis torosa]|uniref:Uncharacterized protein n=1 Tax=Cyprideis torosa TaxID=163714 RepID=A0A7R8WCU0_9CRUS|nr:unnamed protein product [Cyprideis torosa]CAG0887679.1 unnamed protein product [Cyprideis torosa]
MAGQKTVRYNRRAGEGTACAVYRMVSVNGEFGQASTRLSHTASTQRCAHQQARTQKKQQATTQDSVRRLILLEAATAINAALSGTPYADFLQKVGFLWNGNGEEDHNPIARVAIPAGNATPIAADDAKKEDAVVATSNDDALAPSIATEDAVVATSNDDAFSPPISGEDAVVVTRNDDAFAPSIATEDAVVATSNDDAFSPPISAEDAVVVTRNDNALAPPPFAADDARKEDTVALNPALAISIAADDAADDAILVDTPACDPASDGGTPACDPDSDGGTPACDPASDGETPACDPASDGETPVKRRALRPRVAKISFGNSPSDVEDSGDEWVCSSPSSSEAGESSGQSTNEEEIPIFQQRKSKSTRDAVRRLKLNLTLPREEFVDFERHLRTVQNRDSKMAISQYLGILGRVMYYVQSRCGKEDEMSLDATYLRHRGLIAEYLDKLSSIPTIASSTMANYVKALQLFQKWVLGAMNPPPNLDAAAEIRDLNCTLSLYQKGSHRGVANEMKRKKFSFHQKSVRVHKLQEVVQFRHNADVQRRIQDILEMPAVQLRSGNDSGGSLHYQTLQGYILSIFLLCHGQRPSVAKNMTVSEYLKAQKTMGKRGAVFVISVLDHKTGSTQPSQVALPAEDYQLLQKYNAVCCLLFPQRQYFFVDTKGDKVINPSLRVQRFLSQFGLPNVTANQARRAIETASDRFLEEEQQKKVAFYLCHSYGTAKKHYTYKDASEVAHTAEVIEELFDRNPSTREDPRKDCGSSAGTFVNSRRNPLETMHTIDPQPAEFKVHFEAKEIPGECNLPKKNTVSSLASDEQPTTTASTIAADSAQEGDGHQPNRVILVDEKHLPFLEELVTHILAGNHHH